MKVGKAWREIVEWGSRSMEDGLRVGRRGKRTAVKRFRWNRGSYETQGKEPTSMTSDRCRKAREERAVDGYTP